MAFKLSAPPLIPLIVSCPITMQQLDSTILGTAIPSISASLGVEPLSLNLAITAYLLALAVFIPLGGWSADRFGAKRTFQFAIAIFVVGSIFSGLAQSLGMLIASRIVQGLGGAFMLPISRIILLRSTAKSDLIRAMTWFSLPPVLGPILGPPLGGLIVTYMSWRWIFFLNLPISLLAIVLGRLYLPDDDNERRKAPLDMPGFALFGLGLFGVIFGFQTAGRSMLPVPTSLAVLVGGAAFLVAFAFYARRVVDPAIDFTLLRLRTFRTQIFAGMLSRIAFGSLPFMLPLLLQLGFGLSALESGFITLATGLGSLCSRGLLQFVVRHAGFRTMFIVGTLINCTFLAVNALLTPATPHLSIMALFAAGAICRAMVMTGLNVLGYEEVPRERVGKATSLAVVLQQMSPTIGVAACSAILHVTMVAHGGTELGADDFWPTLLFLAAVPLASMHLYVALPRDAGVEIAMGSGRRK